jgi:DNA helicase-2/ATP-dependent DNA helicase PcrA
VRVRVDAATLDAPAAVVDALHRAWSAREPVVIELAVDPAELRRPARCDLPPYALAPDFELSAERLSFLVWANAYDARSGVPVWWHGRRAARRLPGVVEGGPADVVLADGTGAFVDGGPSHPPAVEGAAVVERWNAEAGSAVPAGHGPPRAELAGDQLEAVTHRSGPARVIAPAGSGKTRVLTERLRHLLAERGVDPTTVTVLAYNTKAADELRQRCKEVVTPAGPQLRTLNSLGLALCNDAAGTRLRVLDEVEARGVVESVFEMRHRTNTDTVVPYLEALSTIRLGLVDPEEAEVRHPDAAGVAEGFDRYRRALAEAGAVDFDEQIYRAVELLLTDPDLRARAQARCRHLLVDEFQDLNPAHLLLIRLLAAPGYDCFGVGDDDQVLYGYSGATPEYLVEFGRYFPGATAHALEVNYRCPPAVVEAAGHLLSYNRRRVEKAVRPAPGRDPAPSALVVRRAPGERLAALVVEAVGRWESAGVGRDQMAVLARVNAALLPVQVALGEAGVATDSTLSVRVLGRTGVRTAFAYLRIGADPERISRRDVEETVRRPSRGIAPHVVAMVTERAHTSVPEIRRLAARLTGKDGPKLAAYAADLDRVVRACRGTTAQALRAVRVEVGLGDTMDVLDGSRTEPDRSTHHDDLLALESVAAFHPDGATFEPWLRGVLERPRADGPAVLLSTVHRIKGREWPRVVVFGVSAGLFPHRLGNDTEGERRVLHVALTRAREEVLVLADADSPSPFLAELDGTAPTRSPLALTAPSRPSHDRPSPGLGAPAPRGEAPARQGPVAATPASAGLRAWRTEVARRDGVPPYVVLSDRHLEGIVAAAPATLAELAGCPGIGPMKLERWGDEILAVLAVGDGGRSGEVAKVGL